MKTHRLYVSTLLTILIPSKKANFFRRRINIMKNILISFLFILTFLLYPKSIFAENEFLIDANVEYVLEETGVMRVNHNIILENVYPTIYAKSYTLSLDNIEAINIRALQNNKDIDVIESKNGKTNIIKVIFPDDLLGKGAIRSFLITFDVDNFAERTGEVWELSIPKLDKPEAFRNYTVNLLIPKTFGKEAYISPEPYLRRSNENESIFLFNKEQISKSGISAGFGKFQVFSFVLKYHLENPLNQKGETQIPLPPDSNFQKMYYQDISPKPENVEVDIDGNWMATYILKPRERVDVITQGFVQIFSKERKFEQPSTEILNNNLKPTEFWQSNDPLIINLSKEYNTPQKIYNYVTKYLTYDYERVKPNVQRLGALNAFQNPNSAICMEFTDLFIAIARAAGIPAREVNGYAYTENPEIQPLSLVSDVLHSWPEYWDYERSAWIPIDPTWGSTTGGVDYFSKLDLRHFAFVFHGNDSTKPYAPGSYKLGPNPQKDVFVNFGKFTEKKFDSLNIEASYEDGYLPFNNKIYIKINNNGETALYNIVPRVFFDTKPVHSEVLRTLLPYSNKTFSVKIPYSFLGIRNPSNITITANDKIINIQGNKTQIVIQSLIMIFIPMMLITTFFLIKHKKISTKYFDILIGKIKFYANKNSTQK